MPLKLGIVRDDRFLEHKTGHLHPEHPNRLVAIHRMLDQEMGEGLFDMEAEMATMEHLELVHTPGHIKKVLKTAEQEFTSLAPDTPASSKSYLAAWLAAGGCIRGLEAMLSGECDLCFALVRPPGHHALPNQVSGFCIFNNLAITARFAAQRYGYDRILILDWDIHHGNGLNNLFYEDRGVFYFSSHDTLLFPHTGDWNDTGRGRGEGFTVNLPLTRDLEDPDVVRIYEEVLSPVVRRYRPQLILVAAGFDGHRDDPVGRSLFSEKAYSDLTRLLLSLREESGLPPILLALEGGYDPPALARCVREVLRALQSEAHPDFGAHTLTLKASRIVDQALEIHRKYGIWTD